MNMVEKIAIAMCKYPADWDAYSDVSKEDFRRQARAAIKTHTECLMESVGDEVVEAFENEASIDAFTGEWLDVDVGLRAAFQAMLSADTPDAG